MEEIDLFPRKNGRRNTEELILSILQKTRNELKTNETPNTIPNSFFFNLRTGLTKNDKNEIKKQDEKKIILYYKHLLQGLCSFFSNII